MSTNQIKIRHSQQRSMRAHISADTSLLRVETLRDSEYSVTPAIILVEGVLQGALAEAPELALASEFGKVPEAWNGRPVVINHPRRNEQFVSAGIPDVWEQEVVGWLFNTHVEEGKLKTEVWANKKWLEDSGFTEVKNNIESSKTLEVSTGLFADIEEAVGTWNGIQYNSIWRNIVPDHLAILENSPGACSVEDGCGTARLNTQSTSSEVLHVQSKQGGCCMSKANHEGEKGPGFIGRLLNFVSSLRGNSSDMNSGDQFSAAATALATVEKDFYVTAVYDNRVIYEVYVPEKGWTMRQRDISISTDGKITIGSLFTEVMPVTDFVPVTVSVNSEGTSPETPEAPATPETEPEQQSQEGIYPVTESTTEAAVTEPESATSMEVNASTPAAAPAPIDLETFMVMGTPKSVEQVQKALEFWNNSRKDLVDNILKFNSNTLTREELDVMSFEQLKRVQEMAQASSVTHDFTGSIGQPEVRGTADSRYNAPVLAFPRKNA